MQMCDVQKMQVRGTTDMWRCSKYAGKRNYRYVEILVIGKLRKDKDSAQKLQVGKKMKVKCGAYLHT
jgi:hypothetical protein